MMKTISQVFVTGVKSIVDKAKEKGRSALYRLSEFLGIKKRLLDIRENVRGAIKTTDKDIVKTELLAKGFREAGQTVTNAFRTFADKPEVDYSQKEQKHPITKAVLAPMKAVKKMLVLMEIHLDASIDKLDILFIHLPIPFGLFAFSLFFAAEMFISKFIIYAITLCFSFHKACQTDCYNNYCYYYKYFHIQPPLFL